MLDFSKSGRAWSSAWYVCAGAMSRNLSLSPCLSFCFWVSLSPLSLSVSPSLARARSLFPKTVNQTENRNPEQEKYEAADGGSAPKNWLSETAVGSQVPTCTRVWASV
jgi:hypothetical protein